MRNIKEFELFNTNEAFEPKRIKERSVSNFVKNCKFYELYRNTTDRSELNYVYAIVTPKNVTMSWGSDKVNDYTDAIPYGEIVKVTKEIWK